MESVSFDPFAGPVIAQAAPTTEPQREVFTAAALGDEASLAYDESISLRLRGPLDVEALRGALADLVARHDSLRTTFSADGLTLLVAPPGPIELPVADVAEAELAPALRRAVSHVFDLSRGPLFRPELLRLGPGEHVLVLTAHHLVCDGWSTGVLVKDLAALYSARVRGEAVRLPPAGSFAAYAKERAKVTSADEKWWVEKLSGELAPLDLPTDRPRGKRRSARSFRVDAVLDTALTAALRKAAARERASLFATLLAGFTALLHRLSAAEELVVGIPAAGQPAHGKEELVGHAVHLLPLRARVSGGEPARALIGRVQGALLDAMEHREVTFGSLLRQLPLPRDGARLPLVEVLFNLDRALPEAALRFAGLAAGLSTNPRVAETYDLFLNATDAGGRIVLECQANAELFDEATVRRWLEGYALLLKGITENAGTEVAALPIVTESDRAQVRRWNDAAVLPVSPEALVHELIAEQAARTPQAVAVELDGRELRYGELEARSNRLAWRLRKLGVRRGALVGLCAERSPELIVGLLAILKAGGAYVPLDPDYPKDRLAFMQADAALVTTVTDELLHGDLQAEPDAPLPRDEHAAQPESPCYVIYTSGSTGKPKGVLVPHRAAVNLLSSVAREPGLTARDVVLAVTTLSFDIALSELVLPLTVGARIALATREVATDGLRLSRLIESAGVTFIDATPATYRILIEAGWRGSPRLTCICTGEAMPKDLGEQLLSRTGALWNGYGPTETCVWSTFWRVPHGFGRVLIGHPVANTECLVLDARLQPVPIGVPGELYLGGRGVATGYLNRPELTAQRFLAGADGRRLYKTGDVVRWLPSGELEYQGRGDGQVKLRGHRIELGEIEEALAKCPGVRQAAVALREDRPGDKRLVAYLVLASGEAALDPGALRVQLKTTLPDYMVPSIMVALSKLPLTPSGKVDKRALPAPDAAIQQAGSDFVEPQGDTEELLAALFREALGLPRVSVHDDFFALGGHSLLASQVLARLRRDRGAELSFRTLFEAPTIAQLAPLVDAQQGGARPKPAAIPRRAERTRAPLSHLQERFYRLEELDPAQRLAHLLPAAWRLKGKLDRVLLEDCLQAFVDRHELLRTGFQERGGQLEQVVHDGVELPLPLIDLRALPAAQREAALQRAVDAAMEEPFESLAEPPLLRAFLARVADDEHVLFTVRHNLIWDGWSFDLFLTELAELTAAALEKRKPKLPELPVAYGDYAAWHREWLRGEEIARQAAWWRERLASPPPPLALPTDRPRPLAASHRGGNEGITLPQAELDALGRLARETGTTLYMVLFAAFDTLLHRWSGQRELLVATPVRARTRPELEQVIGPFVNQVLLRTRLDPELAFTELLAQVKEVTLDAFSHQDIPLEEVGIRTPPVRAVFSLQDAKSRPRLIAGCQVTQVHALPKVAHSDLMLWTMETPSGLLAMLNHATDLFDQATARRFLGQLRTLLAEVAKDPRRPIGQLPLLPAEERALIAACEAAPARATPEEVWNERTLDVLRDAPELLADGEGLLDELVQSGAKVLRAPAESLHRLCDAGLTKKHGLELVSVEPLPAALRARLEERATRVIETALWEDGAPALIDGKPAPGVALRVLEPSGLQAPIGVPGELHEGGQPTGERARWREGGTLELLGRLDGRVRVHGQLVELRRSSDSLIAAAGVASAHVGLREGRLVAWVVPQAGVDQPTPSALRRHLRRAFPEWALPRDFALVPELPRRPDGSVDEVRLPAPWTAREKVAPRTQTERLLAELWTESLGAPPSVHDNFFDLGGHSLLCLALVEAVHRRTGKRVSPRIFLLSSLAQAAAELDQAGAP